MADNITKAERSRVMATIKSKDTNPEMVVRRLVHGMGFRYRLHVASLPGAPDLVFPRLRKLIFVHGCFWHAHRCARGGRIPQDNREYWLKKRSRNRQRDKRTIRDLQSAGWQPLVVWECELKAPDVLAKRLSDFLHGTESRAHLLSN